MHFLRMAAITVRNLSEEVKSRLQARAAANGRSMEEEVRELLRVAAYAEDHGSLLESIRARVVEHGGLDDDEVISIFLRRPADRPPPQFD